ncbi:MAG TPA: DUF6484 domain-containing protein [Polyangia bacterium]
MSRSATKSKVTTPARRTPIRVRGNRTGTIVSWADETTPLVDFPGNPHGPLPARTLEVSSGVSRDVSLKRPKARDHIEVLLTFEAERSDRPIVIGVLTPATRAMAAAPADNLSPDLPALDAVVDGKRVVIEGHDEIVLKCGLASVTLRRNGRVVVRGTYVETRANGVNRIRGGSVEIN